MILLVSGATRTIDRLRGHPNLGVLLTAKGCNLAPPKGITWACDNSAFSGFEETSFLNMLDKVRNRADCLWVAAPDVVGDHNATLELWPKWIRILIEHGLSGAFVAQDGCTVESLPWGRGMRAVFIGGTTRFKLGGEAARIVHEANRRGLWTHMGRVNTLRRLFYAHTIGVKSVDGGKFSKWSETYIPATLEFLEQLDRQHMMQFQEGWGTPEPSWTEGEALRD